MWCTTLPALPAGLPSGVTPLYPALPAAACVCRGPGVVQDTASASCRPAVLGNPPLPSAECRSLLVSAREQQQCRLKGGYLGRGVPQEKTVSNGR